MSILLRYRLTEPGPPTEHAYVFMHANNAEDDCLIQYEGPALLVRKIEQCVLRSYGFRARLMEEYTSPQDLDCALRGRLLAPYQPELVAGQELFDV